MAILEAGLTEGQVIQRIHEFWKTLNPNHSASTQLKIPGTKYPLTGANLDDFFSLCSSEDRAISTMVTLLEAVRAEKISSDKLIQLIQGQSQVKGKKGVPRQIRDQYRGEVKKILTRLRHPQA